MRYSEAYIQHVTQGPFPGQVDPWAETGRYFQQLHSEIISDLLGQIREPLLGMGYIAGRETSLQIAEHRQPDIYVQRGAESSPETKSWDYTQAAEAVMAEPGLLLEGTEPEMDALHIKELESGRLITVVEIVSPRNKTESLMIQDYQERRLRLLRKNVNVVEVDITRSVKCLIFDALVETYPYHIVVHLHDQPHRLIGIDFGQPLKRCALPLRVEVIPVELQAAYDHAYRQTSLAGHILSETQYSHSALPFPSLLAPEQHSEILDIVAAWKTEHEKLQHE